MREGREGWLFVSCADTMNEMPCLPFGVTQLLLELSLEQVIFYQAFVSPFMLCCSIVSKQPPIELSLVKFEFLSKTVLHCVTLDNDAR